MKKVVILITLSVLGVYISFAQSINNANIDAIKIKKQVEVKAKTFCKYVVAVGTTVGQAGAVADDAKTDIIRNRVPGLFWDYYEAPRYMLTTNGPHGEIIRKRKMSDYFVSLKAQSRGSINSARKYELRFVGFANKNKKEGLEGFHFERYLSDGCELWSTTVIIKQFYHKINFASPTADGRAVEQVETTIKDYKVYVIIKPNGKAGVYLGDVERAYNE